MTARPTSVACAHCGRSIPVAARGAVPKTCGSCRSSARAADKRGKYWGKKKRLADIHLNVPVLD